MASKFRRFKIFLPPLPVPPRPPVPSVPVKVRGERRRVLIALPDGKIYWQGWNERQAAVTERAIQKAVEKNGACKP